MALSGLRRRVRALRGDGRGWLLLAVAGGWFLILGTRFVVPALLPTIKAEFVVSDQATGIAVTVLWAGYAVMQFPAGYLVDRIGERAVLAASLGLAGLGVLAYVATPTFLLFVLATGVFGLGTGLFGPARGTVLSRTYEVNDGAAFGAVLAAGSVGAAALPAAAAIAVTAVGWRLTLGVLAPVFVALAVGLWLAVPTAPAGTVADTAGLAGVLRGVSRAIRSRRVALAVAGATIMLFVFQGATAFLTTYLTAVKGLSQATAGSLLGAVFLVGAASQSIGGGLADRFGAPRVLAAIGAVSVVPLAAFPFVDGLAGLTALSMLLGVRMSIGPISNAYVVDLLPEASRGTAWGALRTGFFVVSSFGSTLVGVLAARDRFGIAFLLLAGLTAAGAFVYLLLPER